MCSVPMAAGTRAVRFSGLLPCCAAGLVVAGESEPKIQHFKMGPRGWDCGLEVECLPGMLEALGSRPSITEKVGHFAEKLADPQGKRGLEAQSPGAGLLSQPHFNL